MKTVITNQQEFIQFIETLATFDEMNNKNYIFPDVEFNGLPKLSFNIKGENYSSTLTTFLLNSLSEFTTEIQKTYCLFRYNSANLQKLTLEDRENIDIIFKIKAGSSDGESDNSGIIQSVFDFMKEGLRGMNGWQRLVVLIALVCAFGYLGEHFIEHLDREIQWQTPTPNTVSNFAANMPKHIPKCYGKQGKSNKLPCNYPPN